jgi:hypothetical protein
MRKASMIKLKDYFCFLEKTVKISIIKSDPKDTKSAEKNNAENLLVIHDRKLTERYVKNWEDHARHSEVYVGRGK